MTATTTCSCEPRAHDRRDPCGCGRGASPRPTVPHPVITRLWVEEGCVGCYLCESVCPEVFELVDDRARVRPDVDLDRHEALIREVVETCPVHVIHLEEGARGR